MLWLGERNRCEWAGHRSLALLIALSLLVVIACSDEKPTEPKPALPLWNYSIPEAQGMDRQLLDSAFILAEAAGCIDGLVVIRNGFLIEERYYNGFTRTTPHNVMSVSKSFLSAIVSTENLPGSSVARLRVIASDGVNSALAITPPLRH